MSSCSIFGCIFAIIWLFCVCSAAEAEKEHVLTLDHSNFSETVNKHDFIVVEFYAPWCGHCQKLAPEYEKAALVLSSHDPPIVLAKVDLNEEPNKELAIIFQIKGFPTLKVLRNGGKIVQDYKGPREADGIVYSLKKLLGPASDEIKSAGDVASQFDEKKIFIVGIFPEFSGEEFEKFSIVAETLRSDYDFGHTQDAKHLPRSEEVSKPTLRLFKPFDELSVDFQDFDVDAIKKFIEESSLPLVSIFDENPENEPCLNKFFASPEDKAMLFLDFSTDRNCFESKYQDAATFYKGKGIRFLMGDAQSSGKVFKFFGLSQEQTPLLFIRENNGTKYLKANIQADQIASWLKDYEKGNLKPYIKSEPIPEVNDELVKVVVGDSLQDMVFNSGKNVLLEFFAPWCGYCKRLAPVLEEAAGLYENSTDFMIAKMDATANDVPGDIFEVKRYPTLYFVSADGKVTEYKWDLLKLDIMYFIEKNYGKPIQQESTEKDTIKKQESTAKDKIKSGIVGEVSAKDEL